MLCRAVGALAVCAAAPLEIGRMAARRCIGGPTMAARVVSHCSMTASIACRRPPPHSHTARQGAQGWNGGLAGVSGGRVW